MKVTNNTTLREIAEEVSAQCEAANEGAVGKFGHIQDGYVVLGFLNALTRPYFLQEHNDRDMNLSCFDYDYASKEITITAKGIYDGHPLTLHLFDAKKKRGSTKHAINPKYEDKFLYICGIEVAEGHDPETTMAQIKEKVQGFHGFRREMLEREVTAAQGLLDELGLNVNEALGLMARMKRCETVFQRLAGGDELITTNEMIPCTSEVQNI